MCRGHLTYSDHFSRFLGVSVAHIPRFDIIRSIHAYGKYLSHMYPDISAVVSTYIHHEYEKEAYYCKAFLYHLANGHDKQCLIMNNHIHDKKLLEYLGNQVDYPKIPPTRCFIDTLYDRNVDVWYHQRHIDPRVARYIHENKLDSTSVHTRPTYELLGLMCASGVGVSLTKLKIPYGYTWTMNTCEEKELVSLHKN